MGWAMEDKATGFLTEALPGALAGALAGAMDGALAGAVDLELEAPKKASRLRGPNQVDRAERTAPKGPCQEIGLR